MWSLTKCNATILLLKVSERNFQQQLGKIILKKPEEIHKHFKVQHTTIDLDILMEYEDSPRPGSNLYLANG